jgi:hypothetical protein
VTAPTTDKAQEDAKRHDAQHQREENFAKDQSANGTRRGCDSTNCIDSEFKLPGRGPA